MARSFLQQAKETYRTSLFDDILPFWIKHGVDHEYGGLMTSLDRDGSILDTDKAIWPQGRFAWLLSTLYTTVEPHEEWLALAQQMLDFLRRYGFDKDGRMFFLVTREGKPLRKRRYVFSEAFTTMALAAYAQAAQDEEAATQARDLFQHFLHLSTTPGLLEPKVDPATRPSKSLSVPMITLNLAQVMRDTLGEPLADAVIEQCIAEIRRDFVKPDREAVMETVGADGAVLDHFDGRLLNPGHAIEAAAFILHEARYRGGDADLTTLGTTMLDWMWRQGWDDEFGGLYYFRDVNDR
ncbi:MAG TPA: AGE family epimerase/isomerase, partial [Rhodothermales bacterium]|nr:AGE family epimerase/isomerase [Rhodothermales bacterium]